jgi:hypothetical protein
VGAVGGEHAHVAGERRGELGPLGARACEHAREVARGAALPRARHHEPGGRDQGLAPAEGEAPELVGAPVGALLLRRQEERHQRVGGDLVHHQQARLLRERAQARRQPAGDLAAGQEELGLRAHAVLAQPERAAEGRAEPHQGREQREARRRARSAQARHAAGAVSQRRGDQRGQVGGVTRAAEGVEAERRGTEREGEQRRPEPRQQPVPAREGHGQREQQGEQQGRREPGARQVLERAEQGAPGVARAAREEGPQPARGRLGAHAAREHARPRVQGDERAHRQRGGGAGERERPEVARPEPPREARPRDGGERRPGDQEAAVVQQNRDQQQRGEGGERAAPPAAGETREREQGERQHQQLERVRARHLRERDPARREGDGQPRRAARDRSAELAREGEGGGGGEAPGGERGQAQPERILSRQRREAQQQVEERRVDVVTDLARHHRRRARVRHPVVDALVAVQPEVAGAARAQRQRQRREAEGGQGSGEAGEGSGRARRGSAPRAPGLDRQPHEVGLGQEAHQPALLHDRQAADLALQHDARGVLEERVRADGRELPRHHVLHQQDLEQLLLRVLPVAQGAGQRAAEEVALAHEADQLALLVVEHREVADAPEPHHVVRDHELVVLPQRGDLAGHPVAHPKRISLRQVAAPRARDAGLA